MRENKQSRETKKNNFFIELFLSGSSFTPHPPLPLKGRGLGRG
jgi:hypothetical protein